MSMYYNKGNPRPIIPLSKISRGYRILLFTVISLIICSFLGGIYIAYCSFSKERSMKEEKILVWTALKAVHAGQPREVFQGKGWYADAPGGNEIKYWTVADISVQCNYARIILCPNARLSNSCGIFLKKTKGVWEPTATSDPGTPDVLKRPLDITNREWNYPD